ncbi:MAG: RtcB family protein [Myxococcales bacterium]|nr:RtcB family protein [Myxococcales bacterium]
MRPSKSEPVPTTTNNETPVSAGLAPMTRWWSEPPPEDVQRALERLRRAPDVARVAVMPDVHLAREVCVGTVLATRRVLYPAAVGGDIGCGMATVAFEGDPSPLTRDAALAERVLDDLERRIPILRHGKGRAPPMPDALRERSLSAAPLERHRVRTAPLQLGTLGRGNHFLELQLETRERAAPPRLWLMLHSGSRAIGREIRAHHERAATISYAGLKGVDAESPAGRAYLEDMDWALRYASANRDAMLRRAVEIVESRLGLTRAPETRVDCHHNFVRLERPDGQEALWVHRKGAISAAAGEPGLIPGSMGTPSYHVEGRGLADALCSSAHGAGRRLARGAATRAISTRRLRAQLAGVRWQEHLADKLRSEAPDAYKDIHAVMRAQRPLTRVVRELRPVLSYKGP